MKHTFLYSLCLTMRVGWIWVSVLVWIDSIQIYIVRLPAAFNLFLGGFDFYHTNKPHLYTLAMPTETALGFILLFRERNNCSVYVREKQRYSLCLRETSVQSVSARNNCTICVCEKQLYNLCLRETTVQPVSARNNCTTSVCEKQLYILCLRETVSTIRICEKHLYSLCLRETTVQSVCA
jgi:hypothetical protein